MIFPPSHKIETFGTSRFSCSIGKVKERYKEKSNYSIISGEYDPPH